jgi:hypothetical protein
MSTTPNLGLAAHRMVVAAALGVLLPLIAVAQAPAAAEQEQRFAAAKDEYEVGHYTAAFTSFAALADAGHAQSARIALQMLRHGSYLYHERFAVGPKQVERWSRTLKCSSEFAGRDCLLAQQAR